MTDCTQLKINLEQILSLDPECGFIKFNELTVIFTVEQLISFAAILKDNPILRFDTLIDICGVDYLECAQSQPERFAVVYHLLSTVFNHRLRVKVFLSQDNLRIPSVITIWPCANWYEREAFDLFGILFDNHPDLRRILTDYDFVGHPFRKDFPLIGNVEMRYDATAGRVVYEPVSIEPRTLVPKVIREDNRYLSS